MDYKITKFDESTAQVEIVVDGMPPFMVDLPVDDEQRVPTGEALDSYLRGFIPTWHIERIGRIAQGIVNAEAVRALVQPAPVSNSEIAFDARARRDALLLNCDWTQLADAPLGEAEKSLWVQYRQLLRDIPEQQGFPATVQWPVAPNQELRFQSAVACLSALIAPLAGDVTVVEVGAWRAETSVGVALACSNVTQVTAIDSYTAFTDVLHGSMYVSNELSAYNNSVAAARIAQSGAASRVGLLVQDADAAANQFAPNSVSVVFLDRNLTAELCHHDIVTWLPKVKQGGMLCGFGVVEARIAREALNQLGVSATVSTGDDSFWWVQK